MARSATAAHHDPAFLDAYGAAWSAGGTGPAGFFAAHAVYVDVASDVRAEGPAGADRFLRWQLAFASDSVVRFTSLIGDERHFSAEWTWSGTADGKLTLAGTTHAGTDRHFSVPGVAVCSVDETGAIILHKDYWDMRTLLAQIGLAAG